MENCVLIFQKCPKLLPQIPQVKCYTSVKYKTFHDTCSLARYLSLHLSKIGSGAPSFGANYYANSRKLMMPFNISMHSKNAEKVI